MNVATGMSHYLSPDGDTGGRSGKYHYHASYKLKYTIRIGMSKNGRSVRLSALFSCRKRYCRQPSQNGKNECYLLKGGRQSDRLVK